MKNIIKFDSFLTESTDKKFKLSDNVDLAISKIPENFIAHYQGSEIDDTITVMEKHGNAIIRIHWYNDDNSTVYLYELNVNEKSKKQGIGTELLTIAENVGLNLGADKSCIWVEKDSWMYKWYKKLGYSDFKVHDKEDNTIWMMKTLKND
jgi:hypothetical protein